MPLWMNNVSPNEWEVCNFNSISFDLMPTRQRRLITAYKSSNEIMSIHWGSLRGGGGGESPKDFLCSMNSRISASLRMSHINRPWFRFRFENELSRGKNHKFRFLKCTSNPQIHHNQSGWPQTVAYSGRHATSTVDNPRTPQMEHLFVYLINNRKSSKTIYDKNPRKKPSSRVPFAIKTSRMNSQTFGLPSQQSLKCPVSFQWLVTAQYHLVSN